MRCGGHTIERVGGAPRAGFGRALADDRAPGVDASAGANRGGAGDAADAGYGPAHDDGSQPTISEPAGLNRQRWDELVFNAHDQPTSGPPFIEPLGQRQTQVIEREVVPTIGICVQGPEHSKFGKRVEPYANEAWWRRQIDRWSGLRWSGEFRVDDCTREAPDGWIHVREAEPGRFAGPGVLAAALDRRERHPHGRGRWLASELVWNPDMRDDLEEEYFEASIAHELGHALGFSHVPGGTGYVMAVGITPTWPDEESDLTQLAYRVGPNVRYPGLVREAGADDADPDDPDRPALTALYDKTAGQDWADSTHWGTAEPLGRWYGITTGADGRVTEVNLHVNDLSGTIPSELGRLSSLKVLQLYENNLTGPIPSELAILSELNYLDLERNALNGQLPEELGDLANLEHLGLALNELTGLIPAELATLSKLKGLRLQLNDLTGPIPPELGRLASLTDLGLNDNKLRGPIPAELGRLSSLIGLSLGHNALTGPIPPALGDLSRLWTLYLDGNNLTGTVPQELGHLSRLRWLRLGGNNLSGPLPASFTNLRQLELLEIGENAGLCAPADDAFQTWLATVPDFRGETCAAEPVPVLPGVGLVATGLLLGGLGASVVRRRRSKVAVWQAPDAI